MFRRITKKLGWALAALVASLLVIPTFVSAGPPPRAMLYLDGQMVRTLALPSPLPNGGRDPIYVVTNGVDDQLGIAAVGPGYAGYHGGAWAVYQVTFNDGVTPYLLTSDEDVFDALYAGDATFARAPHLDNRCPVQR